MISQIGLVNPPDFLQFCRDLGISVGPVKIWEANGDRNLLATSFIPANRTILVVPLSSMISSDLARVSEIGQLVMAAGRAMREQQGNAVYLAWFVLQERSKGAASKWWPFIRATNY